MMTQLGTIRAVGCRRLWKWWDCLLLIVITCSMIWWLFLLSSLPSPSPLFSLFFFVRYHIYFSPLAGVHTDGSINLHHRLYLSPLSSPFLFGVWVHLFEYAHREQGRLDQTFLVKLYVFCLCFLFSLLAAPSSGPNSPFPSHSDVFLYYRAVFQWSPLCRRMCWHHCI